MLKKKKAAPKKPPTKDEIIAVKNIIIKEREDRIKHLEGQLAFYKKQAG